MNRLVGPAILLTATLSLSACGGNKEPTGSVTFYDVNCYDAYQTDTPATYMEDRLHTSSANITLIKRAAGALAIDCKAEVDMDRAADIKGGSFNNYEVICKKKSCGVWQLGKKFDEIISV